MSGGGGGRGREGERVGEEVGTGEEDDRAVRLPPARPATAHAGHAATEENGSREWGRGREREGVWKGWWSRWRGGCREGSDKVDWKAGYGLG